METYQLTSHPAFPPSRITHVEARIIGHDANWLRARWRIEGTGGLVVPPFAGKGRADELWKTTCFELFFKPLSGDSYTELNLSPSERWNAYDFQSNREGMQQRPFPQEPQCTLRRGTNMAIFDAAIPVAGLPSVPCKVGFTAVLEEEGGLLSYWSMAHASEKPDFHDAACFAATLTAPTA